MTGSRTCIAVLLLLVSVLGGCAAAASRDDHAPRLISARGTGRVAVKPDTAVVWLGAEARALALAEATADVARRSTAILASVKSLGVADRDITTTVYSIDPIIDPPRTAQDLTRILGYRVVNMAQVKIRDLGAVERILDGALAAGANTIAAVQFTVDDRSKAEAGARALAVRAAASTAQQLAAAAGVSLGELVSLTEDVASRPVMPRIPYAMAGSAMPVTAMSGGPVESGQLEIVVSVEAHYRIAR
jgi:uncharacterized protein